MNKGQRTNDKSRIVWLIFAFLTISVYFFGLTIPLLGPDEPRYAQIAREMLERADWITPKLGGFDWFEKPALLYWLEIVSYQLFGINEFAARFGSALCGLGTILSLWILGKKIQDSKFQIQDSKSKAENQKSEASNLESEILNLEFGFANWLALIAASSIGLIAFSRAASFDIVLTFPLTAALAAFFIFDQSRQKNGFNTYLQLAAFYFFIGIALIAKGLIGIVFPFAIVAFYYVLSWKMPAKTFVFSLFWGTILTLSVTAVWYLPMYRANGWKFVDEFIIQHHFQRFTSDKYQHRQPFWFFFAVLPLMTIPWLPFFVAAIWNFIKVQSPKSKVQSLKNSQQSDSALPRRSLFLPLSASPLLLFSLSWMLVPLVFFSISGSKLPGYILPALPAALVLTAEYVFRFVQKSRSRKLFVQSIAFLTFAVVAFLLQFVVTDYAQSEDGQNAR